MRVKRRCSHYPFGVLVMVFMAMPATFVDDLLANQAPVSTPGHTACIL